MAECIRTPLLFLRCAGGILVFTGLLKLLGLVGSSRLVEVPDPIFGVRFQYLLLAVGLMELAVGFVCLFGKSANLGLGLVAWISSNFLMYRIGLWLVGWQKPCGCLGNFTEMLHISPKVMDWILKAAVMYMFIGSYLLLLRSWGRSSQLPRPS